MTMPDFRPGDFVQPRSGGSKMIVERCNVDGTVDVVFIVHERRRDAYVWFDGNRLERTSFSSAALAKVTEGQ